MRNHSFLIHLLRRSPVLASIVFCIVVAAFSQTPDQLAEITKSLSPRSQKVMQRLSELSMLPQPNWRFLVGDTPHGEAFDVNDSSWETVNQDQIARTDNASWYRAWVTIPKTLHGYDLTGSKIWFQFRFRGDGTLTALIYFNGRRVAMGESLEPIILLENAKPGDRVLVAVKLPTAAREKRFRGSFMRIEASPSRPNPGDLWQELVFASAFTDPSEKPQLERAITSVNLEALEKEDQAAFDSSLTKAHRELEPLRASLQKYTFFLNGNSHIDSAWLWPWSETVEAVRRTFGTATQLMQEYPDYTFSQSAAQHSEWIADKYPQINDEIKKRIKEGRWEIVGGMWVEPDLNMPDGESLVRQLLVGTRYFKQQYGVDVHIGWNPDSFGYTWQLPQIYKKSGIDSFITAKLGSNETHKLPFSLFWWESPDGSKILTYLPRRYDNVNLSLSRISADLAPTLGFEPGLKEQMDMYGIGDHGGGPTRVTLDEGQKWMRGDKFAPKMRFSTAQSFFDTVKPQIGGNSPLWNYRSVNEYHPPSPNSDGTIAVPTWNDELYYEFHRGVWTTQANHKRSMREGEEQLLNSEKYASLAWLYGDQYPVKELTEAWKKVLFNQFHDLAAGSGIGVIYKEAQKDYADVRWATNEIIDNALRTIASNINTRAGGDVPIMVFNPLGWRRSGLVAVDVQMPSKPAGGISVIAANNRVLASTIVSENPANNTYKLLIDVPDLPSLGYKILRVVPGGRPVVSDLKANGLTLENAFLRVSVDPKSGNIASLFNKKGNFETLAPGTQGNLLQTFADNPKCCDAWNIDPGTLDHPVDLTTADSVELVEKGPFKATIRVKRHWQNSNFIQDINLYENSDQVEVSNDIDWHEKHQLLKVAFPLSASSDNATYEIAYGTIQRPTTRNNSWEQTRFEGAALRWVDLGNNAHGFSLINDAKYGYDAKDNVLRLSLLRSPTSPDPDADQGHHHFTYSLYPHSGDWKQAGTMRRGYEYNYKLTAVQVQPHTGSLPIENSFVSVEPENIVLTAAKKAEDSDGLIFRVFEWAGKSGDVKIKVPPGATGATITNLMEKEEGSKLKVTGGLVTFPIKPYEILSVRVDYARRQP
jgi:alpha-mannosidase